MSLSHFPFSVAVYRLDGRYVAEPLQFPEISSFLSDPEQVATSVTPLVRRTLKSLPLVRVHTRCQPATPVVDSAVLTFVPPRSTCWSEPVTVTVPFIRWSHTVGPRRERPGEEPIEVARVAAVPMLGLHVICGPGEDLNERVIAEVEFALGRAGSRDGSDQEAPPGTRLILGGAAGALAMLMSLERCRELRVVDLEAAVRLATPLELFRKSVGSKPSGVLASVATDLTLAPLKAAHAVDEAVTRLAEMLSGRSPRSVLLVGPSGVGKTALVHELARQRSRQSLSDVTFWATSGSRLVAGMTGFGMWQQRCLALCRELSGTKGVLHLGNLAELAQVGQSLHNEQGIADFMAGFIGRGEILAVAECTGEQLTWLETQHPHVIEAFQQLVVEEPGEAAAREILLGRVIEIAGGAADPGAAPTRRRPARGKGGRSGRSRPAAAGAPATLDEAGLEALDRLHRRYATASVYPGRPLRFLDDLLHDAARGATVSEAQVTAAFSRETGLPLLMLDDRRPLEVEPLVSFFEGHVIGQPEATRRAADVLLAAKARLSRPRRPIASLLFVGPTGVGKTELAKAFAEFLFGHRDRLTRFDMSEFADRVGWLRLIGSGPGSEGLLTSRLREQPFSVVLLDEFEKAHPAFFDLLLQILGDARLTDSAGRLADFRNAVVILTSNLGAQTFHRGVVGFDGADQAIRTAGAHFVEAVRSGLRPELYNRIDHVIPFLPLSRSAMLAIARREIELALGRDGFRHMRVELAPGVTEQLALAGYDARLGARPLKRALERQLLEPLARARCARPESVRLRARVGPGAEALAVEVEVEPQRPGRPALEYRNWDDLVGEARELRLSVRALGRCTALLELQNEAFAAEKLQERLLAGGPGRSRPETKRRQAPGSDERLRRLGRIRQLVTRASCLTASASSLEETVLAELYGPRTGVDLGAAGREAAWAECERLRAELGDVMRELLVMRTARANAIVLAIYGEHPGCLFTLAQLYHDVGGLCGFDRRVVALRPPVPGSAGADHLSGQVLASPDRELAGGLQGPVVGILLAFGGLHAKLLFAPEAGSHIFTSPDRNKERRCLVEALDKELGEIEIPAVMARRGQIPDAPRRRAYDRSARSMEDELLHVSSPLDAQELHRLLRDGMLREAVDLLDR